MQYGRSTSPQINEYTFMGGASYRFYRKEKVSSQRTGARRNRLGNLLRRLQGPEQHCTGNLAGRVKPAFSLGVSADYNFFPNLALRFTPTYVGTNFGGTVQNNIGFNAGVIYRFGKQ